jgi:hypothetical protein
VFRVSGGLDLEDELRALSPRTLLVSGAEDTRICLVVLHPPDLAAFGAAMRRLAVRGEVTRVEAEPHL